MARAVIEIFRVARRDCPIERCTTVDTVTEAVDVRLSSTQRIVRLDHAKIVEGPGGSAEMVPGQHHARMSMYFFYEKKTEYEMVRRLGVIDPMEETVSSLAG